MIIRFFAAARDVTDIEAWVPEDRKERTVKELRLQLSNKFPQMEMLLPRCAIAINLAYADETMIIRPGDDVAVLPPVSGG